MSPKLLEFLTDNKKLLNCLEYERNIVNFPVNFFDDLLH